MKKKINNILENLTLEEKVSLCSGKDFWTTATIERLGIKSLLLSDGPHGLRKPVKKDNLFVKESHKAVCFPTASSMACSWNRDLLKKIGEYLGIQCQAENVNLLLGPGINIKRSPLCGRNFEYYSEDPYLTSELAINFINGVQNQGIGTSLKHFAVNNQEHRRMSVDVTVEERTLREIYLLAFERTVKNAKPTTIMSAYNKVNGEFCSQNKYLLTDILRNEWGYEGMVISDWGAVYDIVSSIKAGNDLEMPTSLGIGIKKVLDAIKNGNLTEKELDRAVKNILKFILNTVDNNKKNITYSMKEHHEFAIEVSRESIVLLKNEDSLLPLDKSKKLAFIGEFAKKTRIQGGGSSHINPTQINIAIDEIRKRIRNNLNYKSGYTLDSDICDINKQNEAVTLAKDSDVTIIFAGLPDSYESEGFDRQHLSIPKNQLNLINKIQKLQKNIVVVLFNGAPIEMPWINDVKAVVECYLGGEGVAVAATEILFGESNPCGKLAETFPIKIEDTPSFLNFPGESDSVKYKEDVFVGYRYYDTKKFNVLFPFGHGLSYTNFNYSDLHINKTEISDTEKLNVSLKIKNTGILTGKEIVQLYVKDVKSSVLRPEKELKNFKKIELLPNEEKIIIFELDKRDFAYYDVELKDWHVETGEFEILLGKSSRDICLIEKVKVISSTKKKKQYTLNSTFKDLMADDYGNKLVEELIIEFKISKDKLDPVLGIPLYNIFLDMPIRTIPMISAGKISYDRINKLLEKLLK